MSTVCVDTATAAARRRQRRLRSWLRHERMTVAMTLAEKLHHTSRGQKLARVGEEVVHDAHEALRRQKTPPPGVRPSSLFDPGPQRSDRTVRRSSGEVPLLAVPVLAGGDGVDGTALSFLVRRAVEDRKREKEEKARKKKEAQEKADLELAKRDPWWAQHLADMKAMEERRSKFPLFGILFVQAEEEEEEEEADASYLLSSWPRSSSTTTVVRLQCWFYW